MCLTKKSITAAAVSFILAAQANAAGYLGLGVGGASVDEPEFEDAAGLRLTAGYRFHENFAFQLSYVSMGDFEVESNYIWYMNRDLGADRSSARVEGASIEVNGFDFAFLAMMPFSDTWLGYARLGVFSWELDGNVDFWAEGIKLSHTDSESGNDFSFGLGVEYKVNENWSFLGEATTYEVDEGDVSFVNIGANFRF